MSKTGFISELTAKAGCTAEEAAVINEVMESHFIFSAKKKDETVADIMNRLSWDKEKSEKVYETAVGIVKSGVKDKLKHPFGSQD